MSIFGNKLFYCFKSFDDLRFFFCFCFLFLCTHVPSISENGVVFKTAPFSIVFSELSLLLDLLGLYELHYVLLRLRHYPHSSLHALLLLEDQLVVAYH